MSSDRSRRLGHAVMALLLALGAPLTVTAIADSTADQRPLAACDDVVDTTDSFSMNCVPTMIPDTSDQLTEAEVAEPGFNAVPGGGTASRR